MIAEETGVVHVADPLGGSYFAEALTDEMVRAAEEIFAHNEEAGSGSILEGVFACIEDGWFITEIADASYRFQSKLVKGECIQVAVNGYTEGDLTAPPILSVDPAVETPQLASLAEVKQSRDDGVREVLTRLGHEAADPAINLLPTLTDAATAPGHRRRIYERARDGLWHLV